MTRQRWRRPRTGEVTRSDAPAVLLAPALLAAAFLLLPLLALVLSVHWGSFLDALRSPAALQALRLSLVCATLATLFCVVVGVPLAWVLARTRLPGRGLLRALVTVPLVLPPVVGGVALLMLLGRRGLLGARLDAWFAITLPFSTPAVVLAEAFVAMPFLIVSVEGTLRASDVRYEEAAATLGASRWTTFRRVTVPMVAPGIAAGAMLSFARALGEFGATITFAGSYPGTTRTLPVTIYLTLESDPEAAVAMSVVLLAISVIVLVSLRGRWAQAVAP